MRCISVLGPPHTGKSVLVDHLCGLEGSAPEASANGSLRIAPFRYLDEDWCAIDCPGAIDALYDCHNALLASDAAVICVSPDPEDAVLAAPYLRAVEAAGIPCLIFINKMDEARGRVRDIVAGLQDYSTHALVLRQVPIREGDQVVGAIDLISERAWRYREEEPSALIEIPADAADRESEARTELLESLSDFDDWLLEELVEDHEPASGPLYAICTRTLRENRVIPALLGAGGHGNGVTRLMKALRHEAPQVDALRERLAESAEAPPQAVGFHAQFRQHVGKTVYLRALGEGVAQGTTLAGANVGGLVVAGAERTAVEGALEPGHIAAAVKSDQLSAGHLYSTDAALDPPQWAQAPIPNYARLLTPANERDDVKLSSTLARIAQEDPGIVAEQEEGSGTQLVRSQGVMHLRKLREMLSSEFGIEVEEHMPAVTYRETITGAADVHYRHRKQTGGAGQFADVRLKIRPNDRGEGFSFDETVKGGAVPRNYIPAVEAGARDAMEKGPLGFPVIDVAVTLYDGQHHNVDSSDFAFRTAGRAGVAQALADAAPVLLQTIHKITCHVPSVHSGALVPIVSSLRGQVLGFDRDPEGKGWDIFRALLPGSALDELALTIRSSTQGIGYFESEFDHFEEVYGKDADKIIEARTQAAE